jgi:hypothetical protein
VKISKKRLKSIAFKSFCGGNLSIFAADCIPSAGLSQETKKIPTAAPKFPLLPGGEGRDEGERKSNSMLIATPTDFGPFFGGRLGSSH